MRFALITTAGLHFRGEPTFDFADPTFRPIAIDRNADELIMSHSSANFDRSGFSEDVNLVFPIDRFQELVADKHHWLVSRVSLQFYGRGPHARSLCAQRRPGRRPVETGLGRRGILNPGLTQLHPRRVRAQLLFGSRRHPEPRALALCGKMPRACNPPARFGVPFGIGPTTGQTQRHRVSTSRH